ncbi:zinc finger A20 and AN1 domain-containing stress-associated protein 6-like protein [Carex littledalei]|uniref:Zinc finger A20 and AN1 domain-containing stress-associated protein 6-like protein n=1 Tax=Carex littledalei TaxID=544730 RepID=A0A833QWX3_9POAL|nr:zinc finger A20 and AN1 domain-containing stress-associated protein 6-like protein [Carex littledalei]
MAQESWKKETTDETEFQKPEAPVLCINNCGFFGSPGTNNLCSKCYRDLIINTQIQSLMEISSSSSTSGSAAAPSEPISQTLKTWSISQGIVVESSEKKVEIEVEPKKPVSNRCLLCKKKVGLTGFKCRCGGMYCPSHRYYESHKCTFDYKTAGRDAIAKENPVVMAEKIDKI